MFYCMLVQMTFISMQWLTAGPHRIFSYYSIQQTLVYLAFSLYKVSISMVLPVLLGSDARHMVHNSEFVFHRYMYLCLNLEALATIVSL